jgi:hypothetical protein
MMLISILSLVLVLGTVCGGPPTFRFNFQDDSLGNSTAIDYMTVHDIEAPHLTAIYSRLERDDYIDTDIVSLAGIVGIGLRMLDGMTVSAEIFQLEDPPLVIPGTNHVLVTLRYRTGVTESSCGH